MTGIEKAIEAAGGQTALAEMLGCSQQNVAKMKSRGFCPVETAEKIAERYGIPVLELVSPSLRAVVEAMRKG